MALFHPQRYVASVPQIGIEDLVKEGVTCLLLDRDNTCVPRNTKVAPPEVLAWLEKARAAGLSTCLVSNNFHSRDVEQSGRDLGCAVVHHAMKPFPFAIKKALKMQGVSADKAVLIGDQMLTDVAAGNLAGVRTILVRPQSRRDLWYTQLFRVAEFFLLRGHSFEGED